MPLGVWLCACELVPTLSILVAEWQYSHADFTLVSFKASCLLHTCAEESCVWARVWVCSSDLFLLLVDENEQRVVVEDRPGISLFLQLFSPRPPCTSLYLCVYCYCYTRLPAVGNRACPTLIIVSVNRPWSNTMQTNRFNTSSHWHRQIVR